MLPGRTGLARDSHPGRPIRSRKEPAHALSVFQNSISWSVQPELEFERASPYLDDTTPASSHRQHAWSCVLCRPRWYPGGAVRPSCSELIARIIWFRIACYPSGRGICLPLRHLIMGAEPGPGCCCCYPTGRGLRLLLRHLIMDAELELNCCCYCTVARPLRRHKDSTTPAYLAVSCRLAWGGRRRRDRRCYYDHRPPLWWWLDRMDCSSSWLSPAMDRSGPAPTALRRAGWPGGSGIGGAPAAASERLCYRAAAGYMFVCECICMCVVSEGAQTRQLSSTSPSLAGWPVAGGGRGTDAATTIMCFGRRSGGGWTGWTAAAAGSRRGCWRCPRCPTTSQPRVLSCRLCLTGVTQKPGMERSGPAPTALRRAGWPGGSGIGGAPAAATERLRYRAASGYMCLLVLVCMDVVSAGSPLHNGSLLPHHLLPAGLGRAGEEGQALLLPLPAFQCQRPLLMLFRSCPCALHMEDGGAWAST